MRNRMYGGVRGRKTKVGRKLLRFPPTRFRIIVGMKASDGCSRHESPFLICCASTLSKLGIDGLFHFFQVVGRLEACHNLAILVYEKLGEVPLYVVFLARHGVGFVVEFLHHGGQFRLIRSGERLFGFQPCVEW